MLLLSTATESSGTTDILGPILMIVFFLVIFYLFFMRPQNKKAKKEKAMRAALQVGDEIVSIGGIVGRVVLIKDDFVVMETGNDRAKIRILKSAISTVNPLEVTEKE